jgi:hypothetical protein
MRRFSGACANCQLRAVNLGLSTRRPNDATAKIAIATIKSQTKTRVIYHVDSPRQSKFLSFITRYYFVCSSKDNFFQHNFIILASSNHSAHLLAPPPPISAVELLKESPSPALRSCSALAQKYHALARELFNAAFVSCWTDLYDQYQVCAALSRLCCMNSCAGLIVAFCLWERFEAV